MLNDDPSNPIDLERELQGYGYSVLVKIFTQNKNGTVGNKYVKAINKLGQVVYILIDIDEDIVVDPNDLSITETTSSLSIPTSVKNGAFGCVNLDTCGVAFECEGGICTMIRDGANVAPNVSEFVYQAERPAEVIAKRIDDHIAYPVIRISEIYANPDLVLVATNETTRRVRNTAFRGCEELLARLEIDTVAFAENVKKFIQYKRRIAMELRNKIDHLTILNEKIMRNPGKYSPEDAEEVVKRLVKCHELAALLITVCREIISYRSDIIELNDIVVDNAINLTKLVEKI